jgi:hypothetical protein
MVNLVGLEARGIGSFLENSTSRWGEELGSRLDSGVQRFQLQIRPGRARQTDDQPGHDDEAAPELPPTQGFAQPEHGHRGADDGLDENGQGGDVDFRLADDGPPERIAGQGADEAQVAEHQPALGRHGGGGAHGAPTVKR